MKFDLKSSKFLKKNLNLKNKTKKKKNFQNDEIF